MADSEETRELQFGDLSYLFKEPVPRYLTCMICLGLLKEPVATDCCGKMFCTTHLSSKMDKTCPACRTLGYSVSRNKGIDGIVNDLKVFCVHHTAGCEWSGHLCFEPNHRQSDEGCKFEVISCKAGPGCGFRSQRQNMAAHTASECQLREFECEYCSVKGVYKAVVSHWDDCPEFPVACPNSCGLGEMRRKQLISHLATCPEHVITCQFSDIGCNASLKRRDEDEHMTASMAEHIVFLLKENKDLRKDVTMLRGEVVSMQMELAAVKLTASPRKSSSTEPLQAGDRSSGSRIKPPASTKHDHALLSSWKHVLSSATTKQDHPLPLVFSLQATHSEKSILMVSPTFYTSFCGYRLRMTVLPGGHQKAIKKYVSILFHIVPGSYDDQNSWPFGGSLKVELLNQQSDSHHFQKIVFFQKFPDKLLRKPASFPKEYKKGGWGVLRFMKVDRLSAGGSNKFCYMSNNVMYFRISLVSETSTLESSSLYTGDGSSDSEDST